MKRNFTTPTALLLILSVTAFLPGQTYDGNVEPEEEVKQAIIEEIMEFREELPGRLGIIDENLIDEAFMLMMEEDEGAHWMENRWNEDREFDFDDGFPPFEELPFRRLDTLGREFPTVKAEYEQLRARQDSDEKMEVRERLMGIVEEVHFTSMELEEAMHRSPEYADTVLQSLKINYQIDQLENRYHEAEKDEERKAAEEQIREKLSDAFEVSQQIREWEARRIEEELKTVREFLEQRRANKNAIIDRRLSEITRGFDPYEW